MRTYLVKFWGGGGGWFIQQLITQCELQTEQSTSYPMGHAHEFGRWVNATYDNTHATSDQYRVKRGSLINFIVARGDDAMTTLRVYQRAPQDFRMINIVSETPLDVALTEYNHFYKNQIYGTDDYGLYPHYRQMINPLSTEPPLWHQVATEDMVRVLVSRTLERWGDPQSNDTITSQHYRQLNTQFAIPNKELSVQAVMRADASVLAAVSELVGKPITPAMKESCAEYARSQRNLMSKFPAYGRLKSTYDEWRPDQGQI